MALIIKSNSKFTGSETLPSAVDVSMTAQEIYDEYYARVVADGGEIIDAAATLSAIQWAKDHGLAGKCYAVSASWGIKRDGSDNLIKAYGLNGVDFETLEGKANLSYAVNVNGDNAFVYPATDSSLISAQRIRAAYGKTFAFGLLGKHADVGPNRRMYLSFQDDVNDSEAKAWLQYSVNDNFPAAISTYHQDATGLFLNFSTPYADYQGNVGLRLSQSGLSAFRDGTSLSSVEPVAGKQLEDISDTEGRLSIGMRLTSGAYSGYTKGGTEVLEAWFINDPTGIDCTNLSARLAAL